VPWETEERAKLKKNACDFMGKKRKGKKVLRMKILAFYITLFYITIVKVKTVSKSNTHQQALLRFP
jgi:hypothetical protein